MTTKIPNRTQAQCKNCDHSIYQRTDVATFELVWDLVYVEYKPTTTCFGTDPDTVGDGAGQVVEPVPVGVPVRSCRLALRLPAGQCAVVTAGRTVGHQAATGVGTMTRRARFAVACSALATSTGSSQIVRPSRLATGRCTRQPRTSDQ